MEHTTTFILPFNTAVETQRALHRRIETGNLPTCLKSMDEAIGFFSDYFNYYLQAGTDEQKQAATFSLRANALMQDTLAQRSEAGNNSTEI